MGENITVQSIQVSTTRAPHTIISADGRTFKMFGSKYGTNEMLYVPRAGEVVHIKTRQSNRNGVNELQITDISPVDGHDPFAEDVAAGEAKAAAGAAPAARTAPRAGMSDQEVALAVLGLAMEHDVEAIVVLDTYYALLQDLKSDSVEVSLQDTSAALLEAQGAALKRIHATLDAAPSEPQEDTPA